MNFIKYLKLKFYKFKEKYSIVLNKLLNYFLLFCFCSGVLYFLGFIILYILYSCDSTYIDIAIFRFIYNIYSWIPYTINNNDLIFPYILDQFFTECFDEYMLQFEFFIFLRGFSRGMNNRAKLYCFYAFMLYDWFGFVLPVIIHWFDLIYNIFVDIINWLIKNGFF